MLERLERAIRRLKMRRVLRQIEAEWREHRQRVLSGDIVEIAPRESSTDGGSE